MLTAARHKADPTSSNGCTRICICAGFRADLRTQEEALQKAATDVAGANAHLQAQRERLMRSRRHDAPWDSTERRPATEPSAAGTQPVRSAMQACAAVHHATEWGSTCFELMPAVHREQQRTQSHRRPAPRRRLYDELASHVLNDPRGECVGPQSNDMHDRRSRQHSEVVRDYSAPAPSLQADAHAPRDSIPGARRARHGLEQDSSRTQSDASSWETTTDTE